MQATFSELRPLTLEHLAGEEAEAMPLMRRYFKSEEISKDVVGKVGTGRAGLSSAHARHNGVHQAGLPLPVGARH